VEIRSSLRELMDWIGLYWGLLKSAALVYIAAIFCLMRIATLLVAIIIPMVG
jgi:hypothetical protein